MSNSKAPSSTDYVIVFPLDSEKKLSRTTYSAEMTQGRASSDDVNRALNLFDLVFSRLTSPSDFWKTLFWRSVMPFIVFFMFGPGFFLMYALIGVYYLYHKNQHEIQRSKTEIENIMQTVQPGYLKRGLRWRFPEDSNGWVELIKEYRDVEKHGDVEVQVQNIYEPPQNVAQEVQTTVHNA